MGLLLVGACGGSNAEDGSAAASGSEATASAGAAGSATSAANGGTGRDSGAGGDSGASGGAGGSAAGGAAAGAAAADSSGEKTPSDELNGAFTLSLVTAREATAETDASEARTAFLGIVNDGPKPSPNAWVEEQSEAGCTLYTPASPLCDPSCGSSAVCVSDDTCAPYPKSQSVGTITLTGAGDTPVEMTPIGSTSFNYQPKASTPLPYPPCTEGDELSLSVEGGSYQGFELTTRCIAPLEFKGPIALVKDTPLQLTWGPPSDPTLARIQVKLNISHHGGSRGEIRCDVEDTGSLELPASMVNRLLELGVAGFPTIVLTRSVTGGVQSGEPKDVQFIMQQYVEVPVEIEGLISCNDTMLCPDGQTCQIDLTCK